MTTLPWDRWQPVEPPVDEEPELPYRPPDDPPIYEGPFEDDGYPQLPPKRPIDHDLDEVLDDIWPNIKDQVIGYVKASIREIAKGNTVDVLHPTVSVESQGKELVIADAKSRSWRTLVQGLIFDVFAAIIAAIALLSGMDPLVKETWIAFGVLLLKSVVSAVISYFMRLKVTPTIKVPGAEYAVMPVPRPMIEEQKQ